MKLVGESGKKLEEGWGMRGRECILIQMNYARVKFSNNKK